MNLCDACETAAHCLRAGCIPIQEEPPRRLYRVSEWEGGIGGYGIEYTERGRWWSMGAISFRTRDGAHAAIQRLIARKAEEEEQA